MIKKSTIELTSENKIYYTLRVASAMCFIGHGAFGIITKQIWSNYFAVFGIGHNLSFQMMPVLGTIDILMGIAILFYPIRALFIWLIIWGIVTALLRPLSGEPLAEFFERAGNFGAPLALLLFYGGAGLNLKGLGKIIVPKSPFDLKAKKRAIICLRFVVFLLIIGHGWLNLIEKKSLLNLYTSFGFVSPGNIAVSLGILEVVAAVIVLISPFKNLVLALLIWKIATELFYPHYELFEWIERGGSYGTILALWFSLDNIKSTSTYSFNDYKSYAA
jgi:sorbitol-specific phosphotransferase system component IIC